MDQRFRFMTMLFIGLIITNASLYPSLASGQPIEETHDVIIVGTGVSGLSAGYVLKEYDIKILERNNHTGGNTLSSSYDGIPYALGLSHIGQPDGILSTIIQELGLELKEIPSHHFSFFSQGKIYYGLEGLAIAVLEESGYSEFNRFYHTAQEAYATIHDHESSLNLDRQSARAWFDQNHFAPIFYRVYETRARQAFGADLDEISAQSLLISMLPDLLDVPIDSDPSLLDNDPETPIETTPLYSFQSGLAEYTDAITRVLGNRIQLNSNVISIKKDDDWMIVAYNDSSGLTHTLRAKAVILAVPAFIAASLAADLWNEEQKSLLGQVAYSSLCFVSLFSREPVFNQAYDLQIADGMFITDLIDSTRIQRHYNEVVRNKDSYITGVMIAPPSSRDQSIKQLTEEQLLEKIYTALEKIDPAVRNKITDRRIQWFSNSLPVMSPGAFERLERLQAITTGSLALSGSYVLYPDFPSTVQSGYRAASQVIRVLQEHSGVPNFDRY